MNTQEQIEKVKSNLKKMISEREQEQIVKSYQYAIQQTIADKFPPRELQYMGGSTIVIPDVLAGRI